jgi:hypothetical protein
LGVFGYDEMLYNILNSTLKVINSYIDKTLIAFEVKFLNMEDLKTSNTYVILIQPLKIFVPQGELYGDYEKMFLPFDDSTWIAIGLTIIVSSLAIQVIKWISPSNKEIFFGRNNPSPLMEFISILMNGSQPRSVIENAPRVFLLTFIFWSLIFR